MTKIYTLRDAIAERQLAESRAQLRDDIKAARKKVRHWENQVAKYDGEAHRVTLAKFRAQLDELRAQR